MSAPASFQTIARSLEKAASQNDDAVRKQLQQKCPGIIRQIKSDASRPALMRLWGGSRNYDELAKTPIVDAAILRVLSSTAHVQSNGEIVHAGLQHTYGYLFSTIKTQFGYKRDRWVEPTIETGLGITTPTLRPAPQQGTLLANLTYFLSRIAFRGHRRELAILRRFKDSISPVVVNYNYRLRSILRVEETVALTRARQICIHTDFVRLVKPTGSSPDFLLIYSYWDDAFPGGKLITAFPVVSNFVETFAGPRLLGKRKPVVSRFNAYVPGLTDTEQTGFRQIRILSGDWSDVLNSS